MILCKMTLINKDKLRIPEARKIQEWRMRMTSKFRIPISGQKKEMSLSVLKAQISYSALNAHFIVIFSSYYSTLCILYRIQGTHNRILIVLNSQRELTVLLRRCHWNFELGDSILIIVPSEEWGLWGSRRIWRHL